MRTYPAVQPLGFFDVELRARLLEAKGNPLSRLDAEPGWENFRPRLAQAFAKPAKGLGGRPAYGPAQDVQAAGGVALLQFVGGADGVSVQ